MTSALIAIQGEDYKGGKLKLAYSYYYEGFATPP